jgi:hypothetical protein
MFAIRMPSQDTLRKAAKGLVIAGATGAIITTGVCGVAAADLFTDNFHAITHPVREAVSSSYAILYSMSASWTVMVGGFFVGTLAISQERSNNRLATHSHG